MNQALIRRPDDDMISTLDDAIKIGKIAAESGMFPDITTQAKAVMAILAGKELGVPPMAALRGFNIIKGKAQIGSSLLAAMIKKSERYEYKILQSTDDLCDLAWFENGQEVGRSHFTINDAKRAQLIKPDSNWQKYPRAMLFARALTEGQRKYAPDIGIGAMYAPGEIPDTDDVINITPAPVTVPTAAEVFDTPRPLPDTPLPLAWTEDTAAREIADMEAANKIKAGLNAIADEVKAEAPPDPPSKAEIRENIEANLNKAVENLEKAIEAADPVPALTPTLTPAQQKVSDAVMSLWKEHKKDKAKVLTAISEVVKREVKRSSDLTDEEAERVFTKLQTWASTLAGLGKPEPTKTKYDQKNRAHNEQLGRALDEACQRLTILQVPFGPLWNDMADLIEREVSGRKIETRYEMNGEEAQAALLFLLERIAEAERKASEKAAEV